MQQGRQEATWRQVAWIGHLICNYLRGTEDAAVTPDEINPLRRAERDSAGATSGGGVALTREVIRAVARGIRERRGK